MKNINKYDDFENDKEIQKLRKQQAEFLKTIDDSIEILTKAFKAKKSSRKILNKFLLHKSINKPFIIDSFLGTWGDAQIYFSTIEYHFSIPTGRVLNSGTDYYFIGVIKTDNSYPHTIIQPETITLKIENLFTKFDVDFKHSRKFSSKFHVITKDKAGLENIFHQKDLNQIAEFSSSEIELLKQQCYFRTGRKSISIKEAYTFVELAKKLVEIL